MKRYMPAATTQPRRILRMAEVRQRLGGLGQTAMEQNYFKTGRLKKIKFGRRAVGCLKNMSTG